MRVALWRVPQIAQSVLQDGQQAMNPVVGLRLTQAELQAVQGLQRVRLLRDQDEQECLCITCEYAFDSTTGLSLSGCAFVGQMWGIEYAVSGLKCWE